MVEKSWSELETNNHQDHIIAHVLGTTVLGYFVGDETCYLLLDIGFVWNIYLDGEMGLVPHPVFSAELEVDDVSRNQLRSDIDALLSSESAAPMKIISSTVLRTPITAVNLVRREKILRTILSCEVGQLIVETSIATREVKIMEIDDSSADVELSKVAREEQEFIRRQLADELGREPTTAEIDEWLREHTESY